MLWLALFTVASAAECDAPVTEDALVKVLDQAEEAFANLDDAGFQGKVVEASSLSLPCLAVVPSKPTVARFHRTMALHLYGVGEEAGAFAALASARRLDPEFSYAGGLLPEDHPLVVQYQSLSGETSTGRIPEPRSGSVAFDGTAGRERPKGVPTVTQILDASGVPTWTGYVGAGEPLPAYRAIPRTRNRLFGCAGGLAAASVGTHFGAVSTRSSLATLAQDQTVASDTLDSKRATANTLEGVSAGLLLSGVGCAVAGVLVGER